MSGDFNEQTLEKLNELVEGQAKIEEVLDGQLQINAMRAAIALYCCQGGGGGGSVSGIFNNPDDPEWEEKLQDIMNILIQIRDMLLSTI